MTKADKIESAMNWIIGGGLVYFAASALRAALKRKADEDYYASKSTDGVGAVDDEYYIRAYYEDERYGHVNIFCGWKYDKWNGEKYAKWVNPRSRWFEYDFKAFKTRKGAEKAIQELIRLGEDKWNDYPVQFSIISYDEIDMG